jgi:KUP system potassium uptake protein
MTASADRAGPAATSVAALTALGIVYGDLGTSPLYTMQTVVGAMGPLHTAESALGALSLIFWTLVITISVKYCLFVMRADNHGEGGILALMSLVGMNDWRRGTYIGAAMGLLGAALIYGDGVITPSISVLSAVEGLNVAATGLKPYVLEITVAILAALFIVQRFGTARIGKTFGPIMLVWFVVIGLLGLTGVIRHPVVLEAVNPAYGVRLLAHGAPLAIAILGGVFLCATGGEALYADMGHIGRFPIRIAWYVIVLPSLLLSYAGQTGLLIEGGVPPGGNPFFLLAPSWAVTPLVVLATIATIIASQAIITGSFSMTRQAMQLGWMPAFHIRQTSDRIYGEIYVPAVNLMMAIATIAITLQFRSSARLASLYGTAVATTMVLTTFLLFRAMHRVWRWPLAAVLPLAGVFLVVDLSFFAANLAKVHEGGWIPLVLATCIFVVMLTWRTGMKELRSRLAALAEAPDQFVTELKENRIPRVPGTAVFLTRATEKIPGYVVDYVHNMGALHKSVLALNVRFEEQPRADGDRCIIQPITESLTRVVVRYGFNEIPNIPKALREVEQLLPGTEPEHAVFFGTREIVTPSEHGLWGRMRLDLFAFLYRNAARVMDRFNLPPDRTIEISRPVQM